MSKYRGRVNCQIFPWLPTNGFGGIPTGGWAASVAFDEVFVNIIQHLSSSGPALGIEMIAANYGISGTGFDFWDQQNKIGDRAWACFRFHSASLGKFDMFLFYMGGKSNTNFISYGSPISIGAVTTLNSYAEHYRAIGISFASHPSGSNVTQSDGPWNGTYSLTSASIGNPVWKLNSQGKGAFFPRSNGIRGIHSASRGNLAPLLSTATGPTTFPLLNHTVIGEDCFIFVNEGLETNNRMQYRIFSSFTPTLGINHESPYFLYSNQNTDSGFPFRQAWYGTQVQGLKNGNTNAGEAGGCAHPNLLSGSRGYSMFSLNVDTTISSSPYFNSESVERFPLWIALNEQDPSMYSIIGEANNVGLSNSRRPNIVSDATKTILMGTTFYDGSNTISEVRLVMPWSGSVPGSGGSLRTGQNFSIDT